MVRWLILGFLGIVFTVPLLVNKDFAVYVMRNYKEALRYLKDIL